MPAPVGIFGLCRLQLASSPCISEEFLGDIDAVLAGGITVNLSLSRPGIPTLAGGIPGGCDELSMLSWKDNRGSIGGDSYWMKSDGTTSYRDDWHNSLWHYCAPYLLRFDTCEQRPEVLTDDAEELEEDGKLSSEGLEKNSSVGNRKKKRE